MWRIANRLAFLDSDGQVDMVAIQVLDAGEIDVVPRLLYWRVNSGWRSD